jgi:hypothetical protein
MCQTQRHGVDSWRLTASAYCWGGRSGGQDERYFERMAVGDLILAYRARSIVAAAFLVDKLRNKSLGTSLWPDEQNRPYDFVYFFSEPQMVDQSIKPLGRYFGQVYQGLRRLPSSEGILEEFGSFKNFVWDVLGGTGGFIAPNGIEGRRRLRLQLTIERDGRVVRAAKEQWKRQDPLLRCECCGFSFFECYGDLGEDFIEAHHRVPLGDTRSGELRCTTIGELAPVCSNCNRMLHKDELTVEEMRTRILARIQLP